MVGLTTKEALNELRRIKKVCPHKIQSMLLFGSRARGDELFTSDVDVIVISPDFATTKFRDRPDWFLDQWMLPVDLEILCYTPEEFARKKKEIGLVQEAARQGVLI